MTGARLTSQELREYHDRTRAIGRQAPDRFLAEHARLIDFAAEWPTANLPDSPYGRIVLGHRLVADPQISQDSLPGWARSHRDGAVDRVPSQAQRAIDERRQGRQLGSKVLDQPSRITLFLIKARHQLVASLRQLVGLVAEPVEVVGGPRVEVLGGPGGVEGAVRHASGRYPGRNAPVRGMS